MTTRRLAPILLSLLTLSAAAHSGQVSTVGDIDAGTGGLSIDSAGTLYHSDFGAVLGDPATAGTRVWKIDAEGEASVLAEGLNGASGSAFGPDGALHQANIRGNSISRISPDGNVSEFTAEGLGSPVGVVFGADGELFVANCGSSSIQKILPDGTSTRFAESPLLVCPNGLTRDDAGNLYTSNFFDGNVVRVSEEGEVSVLATLPGNNNGHLVFAQNRLVVVARSAHQIYEVSLSGEVTLLAGSGEKGNADGALLEASFCYPNDIVLGNEPGVFYLNEVADPTSVGRKLAPTRIRRVELGSAP